MDIQPRYAYKYAMLRLSDGLCRGTFDGTDYILRPDYVPIADDSLPYAMKYYYPIPTSVTSFSDFQGLWYEDAAHTVLAEGLN